MMSETSRNGAMLFSQCFAIKYIKIVTQKNFLGQRPRQAFSVLRSENKLVVYTAVILGSHPVSNVNAKKPGTLLKNSKNPSFLQKLHVSAIIKGFN